MKNCIKKQIGKTPARHVASREAVAACDILIVGGGGREHAIVKALAKSNHVGKIYAAPGNAGMGVIETGIGATDIDGIVGFATAHPEIGMVVVAPDDPLSMGLVDVLTKKGIRAFGPTKAAARLEWYKAYAKDFMKKYGVPTAEYEAFDSGEAAIAYFRSRDYRVVVKADGLALGKGVIVAETKDDALAAVDSIMADKMFGAAGDRVVIERFLSGYEVSLLAFVDGEHYSLMPTSCDHKRALDGDKGLNTGGMGAYSPCPKFTPELLKKTEERIVRPTVQGMIKEGAPFKGVLYFGLMVDGGDVFVVEYNARFGDPETQSVLPLLESDLYEIFDACISGTLDGTEIHWSGKKSINVVLASGGYPTHYKKGYPIDGLDTLDPDVSVYFAGVKKCDECGKLVTNGGRVLCVQAAADDFASAKKKVYDNIEKIKFTDSFYRHDIGAALD